jgi:hypothetical protein
VPDVVSWWGAITGSVAAAVAVRREVVSRRIRVRVDHGWRYVLTDDDPPQMRDILIYVMVTNTGGRAVPLQHVGWQWTVASGETTDEGLPIWHVHRAEIPLREPVLLEPDGVPHKEQIPVGQMLHLVDPLETPIYPVAFTGGGNVEWHGSVGILAQRIPASFDMDLFRHRLDDLRRGAKPPKSGAHDGLYMLDPEWHDTEGLT